MSFAVSSWGLREKVNTDFPLPKMVWEVKGRFGITDIELCQQHFQRQDARYLQQIVDELERAGGRCVNMPIDVGDMSHPDARRRSHDIEIIKGWFRVAAYIGCPMVRVNTGPADDPQALDRVADSFRSLAQFGKELGVRLVLENHGGLSAKPENILSLVRMVGGDLLGLCPDLGNFPFGNRREALKEMMPHARMVHAKYHQPGMGKEDAHWSECVQVVKESGYAGPVSIEIGQHEDPWESISQAIELWNAS